MFHAQRWVAEGCRDAGPSPIARLEVTPELIDLNAREYLKEWIDDLWRHKDTMLDSYLGN